MKYRITKVYTKQGDDGETRLGGGQKIAKDATRIQAYGTVDELNSVIGLAMTFHPCSEIHQALRTIQNQLFTLGGDLCVLDEDKKKIAVEGVTADHESFLEKLIDKFNHQLPPLQDFILPGGTQCAAVLHQARCICRRAERYTVTLSKSEKINPLILSYLNRLSDALFVFARYENHVNDVTDIFWKK
ncbi:MAG: cob(I)yrinic acid a,c-diamide adenosyltransferase [bacterium]